jgi:hypothetical protein
MPLPGRSSWTWRSTGTPDAVGGPVRGAEIIGGVGDIGEVVAGEVGEFALIERRPQQFHRVHLGSIGGQSFKGKRVLLGGPGPYSPAPVRGQAVPGQDHSLAARTLSSVP